MQQFSQLPLELRRKIWRAVAFIPRNVDLCVAHTFEKVGPYYRDIGYQTSSRCAAPTVLRVCQESRQEALKYYVAGFKSMRQFGDITPVAIPQVYINPMIDTVCLLRTLDLADNHAGQQWRGRFLKALGDMKMRSMAINIRNNTLSDLEWVILKTLPSAVESLEELILFLDASSSYGHSKSDRDARDEDRKHQPHDRVVFKDYIVGDALGKDAVYKQYLHMHKYITKYTQYAEWYEARRRLCTIEGKW